MRPPFSSSTRAPRRGHALVECLVALTLVAIGGAALLSASVGSLALHDAAEQIAIVDELAARETARLVGGRCTVVPLPAATPTARLQVAAQRTDRAGLAGRLLTYSWHTVGAGGHRARRWPLSVGVPCVP
ncbi:MAG: hypothetical protein LCH84_16380 [Gemmatimonadetes bacterium]|nr:hypothetical protein [Gemmatimonadota bacterium]